MVRLFCWPAVPAAVPRLLPNGKTVLEQFLASWPDLSAADRDLLRGWRDPVDRIFVIRGRDADSLILLNLVDDLEYRTYANMGPALSARCPSTDSYTPAWFPSARSLMHGWFPGR